MQDWCGLKDDRRLRLLTDHLHQILSDIDKYLDYLTHNARVDLVVTTRFVGEAPRLSLRICLIDIG